MRYVGSTLDACNETNWSPVLLAGSKRSSFGNEEAKSLPPLLELQSLLMNVPSTSSDGGGWGGSLEVGPQGPPSGPSPQHCSPASPVRTKSGHTQPEVSLWKGSAPARGVGGRTCPTPPYGMALSRFIQSDFLLTEAESGSRAR